MRLLSRYIGGLYFRNYLLTLVGLTALVMTEQFLTKLAEGGFPPSQIATHHFMGTLSMLVQLSPPCAMIATILTISALNRSNELVACYSIGVGLRQIMAVVASTSFIFCCLNLVLQDRIIPPMTKKMVGYYWREMRQRFDFYVDVRKDKIWYRSQNTIYNIRTIDSKTNEVYGMSVYLLTPEFELEKVVDAEKASFRDGKWELTSGTLTTFEGKKGVPAGTPQTRSFKRMALQIEETPTDFVEIEKDVDGLRIRELFTYIEKMKRTGADVREYLVKAHSRISLSFIPIIMSLLAIPFATGRRRQGGIAKDLGLSLALTFAYWLMYSITLTMGKHGVLPAVVAAWLPSAVFLALAAFLGYRKAV